MQGRVEIRILLISSGRELGTYVIVLNSLLWWLVLRKWVMGAADDGGEDQHMACKSFHSFAKAKGQLTCLLPLQLAGRRHNLMETFLTEFAEEVIPSGSDDSQREVKKQKISA